MSIFYPHEWYPTILDISPQALALAGYRGVILDVDNTLTTHDNPVPSDGVLAWLEAARAEGLKLIILSNNSAARVSLFADLLGLDFESNGRKPLPVGYRRALSRMGIKPGEAVAIGDQIFTDILGARLAGIYAIFVTPIEAESSRFFRFKRWLEHPILLRFERRKQH
ncbi:MAG: YqeG family HAD IIIA-type phosphatase [Candidatus Fimivivens sp.]